MSQCIGYLLKQPCIVSGPQLHENRDGASIDHSGSVCSMIGSHFAECVYTNIRQGRGGGRQQHQGMNGASRDNGVLIVTVNIPSCVLLHSTWHVGLKPLHQALKLDGVRVCQQGAGQALQVFYLAAELVAAANEIELAEPGACCQWRQADNAE
jgi:hypothetical protein